MVTLKQKPETKTDNTYNLQPRKPQPTSPEPDPEQEGYNLCSHDNKPAQNPDTRTPRPSKSPSKPDKPGKVVFQSYGL